MGVKVQKWKRFFEAVLVNPAPNLSPTVCHLNPTTFQKFKGAPDGESRILAIHSQYHQGLRKLSTPQGTNSMWSWVE